ncbi:hypothetical protein [Portibacter lacus]|uniref:Uncharacterized protein n=1 Tax=Portibacter lacus TaxID=1099794 RepID=A0AA37WIR9_9BACT|nr:hypothetical protein [Portibacter lacus]GLR20175.1 hypothetical protein GCM10007940_47910 [Portibacter lacus]
MGEFENESDILKTNISHGENAESTATMAPPTLQLQANNAPGNQAIENGISLSEAKRIIIDATDGWGTDESAIYDAIRRCSSRSGLKSDGAVLSALAGDMDGHELWKAYLLMEYGSESNYPSSISALWKATKGAGTNEDGVFAALDSMDLQTKKSFGLKYILQWELSGDDLQKALDLITTQDSIQGNTFGSEQSGEEELVITEDKLRALIGSQFTGAESNGLRTAMVTLYSKPGGTVLQEAISQIENIRGLSPGSGLSQYTKAMAKQTAGVDHYKKHKEESGHVYDHAVDNPSPALNTSEHPDFTGSNAQLRFGKILGDVFGIDAVFGSLISPTGGMAGPGNERVPLVEDGSAVATHGAVHDAAGYLYNCHGIGPGYDYLGREPGADTSNPLAGQTNMDWWIQEYDKRDLDVDLIERFLNSKAHIGAAFAKHYDQLTLDQKKEILGTLCGTMSLTLKLAGISNTDRVAKVRELMNASNSTDQRILADHYYNNDTFGSVLAASDLDHIMRPHATKAVYDAYIERMMRRYDHY